MVMTMTRMDMMLFICFVLCFKRHFKVRSVRFSLFYYAAITLSFLSLKVTGKLCNLYLPNCTLKNVFINRISFPRK